MNLESNIYVVTTLLKYPIFQLATIAWLYLGIYWLCSAINHYGRYGTWRPLSYRCAHWAAFVSTLLIAPGPLTDFFLIGIIGPGFIGFLVMLALGFAVTDWTQYFVYLGTYYLLPILVTYVLVYAILRAFVQPQLLPKTS